MNKNNFRNKKTVLCFILLFVFLGTISCAQLHPVSKSAIQEKSQDSTDNDRKLDLESLENRMAKYWSLNVARQFKKSYEFEAPHIKYQISLHRYLLINFKARKLNDVKPLNVSRSSNTAVVRLKLVFKNENNAEGKADQYQIISDNWIELNGIWYHVLKNKLLGIN